ncbi:MAG: FixH family protein [Vicinamibacterales bacterium]
MTLNRSTHHVHRTLFGALALFSVVTAFVVAGRLDAASQTAAPKPKEPTVVLSTDPNPPVVGANDFTATVTNIDGKPLVGADVVVSLAMPAMPAMKMAEMKNSVALKAVSDKPADAGKYVGKGQIMMAGTWNVTVTVKVKNKAVAEKKLTLTAK